MRGQPEGNCLEMWRAIKCSQCYRALGLCSCRCSSLFNAKMQGPRKTSKWGSYRGAQELGADRNSKWQLSIGLDPCAKCHFDPPAPGYGRQIGFVCHVCGAFMPYAGGYVGVKDHYGCSFGWNIKGTFSDFNINLLWHELGDINQKSSFPNSVDTNFMFLSYAWLCVFHFSHRPLCWIKSRVRKLSVKITLISYWNDFSLIPLGKCAS